MAAYGIQIAADITEYARERNAKITDLRSDTITKPTDSMRAAMCKAEVGDDVYGEDPTVKKLQAKAAELLGKEDALFVSSGTMGNLIALMIHCDVRGSEAYCGTECHINIHEQGGAASLAGVTLCTFPNNPDGTFDLEKVSSCIRDPNNLHEPISKLLLVENTLNGKVVPIEWIAQASSFAKKHNLKMHLDGARFWNAVTASGVSPKELASHFDSVTFCLSKGLGAPVGSLLCGTKTFVSKAKRFRKVLGGGMRQVGVLAAAGLVALEEIVPMLAQDHKRAWRLANEINEVGEKKGFSVDMATVHTNMVFLHVREDVALAKEFLTRLEKVEKEDREEERFIVRGFALGGNTVRFVLHHQICDELLDGAIRKIRKVISEYSNLECTN